MGNSGEERDYLFNTEKIRYVTGEKPEVECILCAIRDNDPKVRNLIVYRSDMLIVACNLYPFNPGHLMIFPVRHVDRLSDITPDEASAMHELLVNTLSILDEELGPSGYNIGYNLGNGSGASIAHIHQHIVPRYTNEIGFLDILSGTRVIVRDPSDVMKQLSVRFSHLRPAAVSGE